MTVDLETQQRYKWNQMPNVQTCCSGVEPAVDTPRPCYQVGGERRFLRDIVNEAAPPEVIDERHVHPTDNIARLPVQPRVRMAATTALVSPGHASGRQCIVSIDFGVVMEIDQIPTLDRLIANLGAAPADSVLDVACDELLKEFDYAAAAAVYLSRLSAAEFAQLSKRVGITPDVFPRSFLLYSDPADRFVIVVNEFNLDVYFENMLRNRPVPPHGHLRSFVTRLLSGSYEHLVFGPGAPLVGRHPKRMRCIAGDVYVLEHDVVHAVLSPDPSTISLVVKGPPVRPEHYSHDPQFDNARLESERTRLLALLENAPASASGRLLVTT